MTEEDVSPFLSIGPLRKKLNSPRLLVIIPSSTGYLLYI